MWKMKIGNKLLRLTNLVKMLFSKEVIIVYQMGKVGSTSLYNNIKRSTTVPVIQIHRLRLVPGTFVNRGGVRFQLRKIWVYVIKKAIRNKNIKIISVTRNPIKRNISDFFQTLDHFIKVNELNVKQLKTDELIEIFLTQYPQYSSISWFYEQVEKYFEINVYESKLLKKNKIAKFKNKNVELLVFRIEDIKERMLEIEGFLGFDIGELKRDNSAEKKWYGDVYANFINEFEPHRLNYLKDTQYYEFFYK
ncbi:putative capsular polysaccharide synthesis family protein [Vibrio hippocampi]|uniref:Sulfotransferase domain-containing protein n=1 Tax=Vibrio hippocampi TaxID=654686 RepID=A0ABM8ZK34_9VIBR|nr:putative capsular polysaccharide synthesis family protein [Vibrio hippocampi]CAH0527275.1 hypothetical protein VHP8226_02603 [Vibrio hippocampi]